MVAETDTNHVGFVIPTRPFGRPFQSLNGRRSDACATVACKLAKATASEKSFTGEPGGVFGRQKDGDGGDVAGSADAADAAERSLREGGLREIRSDEAAAVRAFSLDHAGTEGNRWAR